MCGNYSAAYRQSNTTDGSVAVFLRICCKRHFFSIPTDTQRSFNFYKMSIQRRRSRRDVLQTSKRHRVSTGYTSGQSCCNISLQWNIYFVRTQHFLKQQHFLPPTLLCTRVYESGVRNINFSKNFQKIYEPSR